MDKSATLLDHLVLWLYVFLARLAGWLALSSHSSSSLEEFLDLCHFDVICSFLTAYVLGSYFIFFSIKVLLLIKNKSGTMMPHGLGSQI